jgi:hypothetical protein
LGKLVEEFLFNFEEKNFYKILSDYPELRKFPKIFSFVAIPNPIKPYEELDIKGFVEKQVKGLPPFQIKVSAKW